MDGLRFARIGDSNDILLDYETFERFKWLFEGLETLILEVVPSRRSAGLRPARREPTV